MIEEALVTKISQEPKVVTIDQINAATAEKTALESAQSTVNPLAQSQAEAYSGTAAMAPGLNLELLFSSGGVMVWRKGAKTFLTRIAPGVGAALTLYEIGSKIVESIRSNPGYFADILAHGIDGDGPDAIATLMRKNLQRGNKGANLPTVQTGGGTNITPPDPDKDPKIKFRWVIKAAKDADKIMRHEKFGNFYRDPTQKIGNKKIWWSKDQAGHGGSKFKLFTKQGDELNWFADIDETGNVMTKHKSEVGKIINFKDLIGIK